MPVERQGLKGGAGTVVEQEIALARGGEPALAVGGGPAGEREAGALRLAPVGAAHRPLLRRCTPRGLQPARRPRRSWPPAGGELRVDQLLEHRLIVPSGLGHLHASVEP